MSVGRREVDLHHIAAFLERDEARRPRVHVEEVLRIDGDRLGHEKLADEGRAWRRTTEVVTRNLEDAFEQPQIRLAAMHHEGERFCGAVKELLQSTHDLPCRAELLRVAVRELDAVRPSRRPILAD